MSEILDPILTLILNYGYPIIITCIVFAYFGLPVPTNAILVAAGAFSLDNTLNIFFLIPVIALTAIIGDLFNYYLGKKFGFLVINNFTKKIGLSEKRLFSTGKLLDHWGSWYIFLTRWLLTPIAIPVNIAAGINKYPFKKFLSLSIIGELIWAILYLSIGYIFGANWVTLLDYINNAPWMLALITLGASSVLVGIKLWHNREDRIY